MEEVVKRYKLKHTVMNIGSAIRQLRKAKGLTQTDLSDKMSISQESISQIESNKKRPHQSTMEKICKVLSCSELLIYLLSSSQIEIDKAIKELKKFYS